MKKIKIIKLMILLIFIITGIVVGRYLFGKFLSKNLFLTPYEKVNIILDIIRKEYVDQIDIKTVTEKAIFNILKELDPYSVYISKNVVKSIRDNDEISNDLSGIGVNCLLYKDTIVVVRVVSGGTASKAGLLPGDRIISINKSYRIKQKKENKIVLSIKDRDRENFVKLEVLRNSSDKIEFEIKKKKVIVPTIKAYYEIEKGIGFIKIEDKIKNSSYEEFLKAAKKLLAIGCKSFILDLRMNKGGSYEAAIKIINEFLPPKKLIVYAKGRSFHLLKSFSNGKGILQKNPIVVLIDNSSASASEIIAGSIQDNDRGLIIGTPSFGKGLIQDQIKLSDGSLIKLTVARYYIPSGRNIQRKYVIWGENLDENKNKCLLKDTDTTVYYTSHKRPVYAKRGIMPDIIVSSNTPYLAYYNFLEKKNIFAQFAFEYSNTNRKKLSAFKNDSSMLKYLKAQPLLERVTLFALKKGIRKNSFFINHSVDQILNTTYAWVLGNFFENKVFYLTYFKKDPVISCSIQAIKNGYADLKSIASMKH